MQKKFYYSMENSSGFSIIKQKIAASVLVGMLAAVLTVPHREPPAMTEAWWGVLYPQYCSFAREDAAGGDGSAPVREGEPRVKIKFRWLHGF